MPDFSTSEHLPVPGPPSSVVLAVLTYRRPLDLPELLPLLKAHADEAANCRGWRTEVLVVDNDASASAQSTVAHLDLPRVRYVVEPTPGIAAARNRALEEAAGYDLLVFIDDDERPEPGWLASMLDLHEARLPAAIAGVVATDLATIEDPWIRAGDFFSRARHATGTSLPAASTANLLLDLRQVSSAGPVRFDEKYGLSGGSDTKFTRELVAAGGKILWCDESVVLDFVRPERMNREWILTRHYRAGNGDVRISLDLANSRPERLGVKLKFVAKALARLVGGTLRIAVGKATGNLTHQALGSRTSARGRGMLEGVRGAHFVEYTRPDSSTEAA